ncbi:MAG: M20/M25/M40 family metallo-hydrolase [Pseudomonadota bacterium]
MNFFRLLAVGALLAANANANAADKAHLATVLSPGRIAAPSVVDGARLVDDLRTLSAEEFAGRRTGTEGSQKAQAFLQGRFAALGLKPFGAAYAKPFSFTANKTVYPSAVNYIGYIAGSARPERFIVVSAHYDHLGMKGGKLHPGADDNASGVAAMLAIAQWFKAHPPRHTIVFAAFDGEEQGLQGARAFMAALPFPQAQLALNLNLDMVGRNANNEIFVAGTRYNPALIPLVAQVAARSTVGIKLGHDRPEQKGTTDDWTGSSDHGAFHKAGVPFLYFGVEDHADYHGPGDTFANIEPAFFTSVANLLVDAAATLDANLK